MPGLILYNRRWSVGSDGKILLLLLLLLSSYFTFNISDCIIPAIILSITHLVWLLILAPIIIITFSQSTETAPSLEVRGTGETGWLLSNSYIY